MKSLICDRQHRTRLKRWLAVLMAVATLCSTLSAPTLSAVAMESNSGYDLTEDTHSAVVDREAADSTDLPESRDTTETGSEAADPKTNESGSIGSDTNVSSPPIQA